MKCPKCGHEDCHKLFNEPQEERTARFSVPPLIIACIGIFVFFLSLIFLLDNGISDDEETKFFGYAMLFGAAVAVLGLLIGLRPHSKQIYKVKVVCKKCGYQFMLEQADIPVMKYGSHKIEGAVVQTPGMTDENTRPIDNLPQS